MDTAHPFNSLAFKSWWGIGAWLRIFTNWVLWGLVVFIWVMTLIPEFYEADQALYLIGGYLMSVIYVWRLATILLAFALSMAFDSYANLYPFDYFQYSNAIGAKMNYPTVQTLGIGLMSEYNFVDYDFEIVTLSGLFVSIPLFKERYLAAEKKIEERNRRGDRQVQAREREQQRFDEMQAKADNKAL